MSRQEISWEDLGISTSTSLMCLGEKQVSLGFFGIRLFERTRIHLVLLAEPLDCVNDNMGIAPK